MGILDLFDGDGWKALLGMPPDSLPGIATGPLSPGVAPNTLPPREAMGNIPGGPPPPRLDEMGNPVAGPAPSQNYMGISTGVDPSTLPPREAMGNVPPGMAPPPSGGGQLGNVIPSANAGTMGGAPPLGARGPGAPMNIMPPGANAPIDINPAANNGLPPGAPGMAGPNGAPVSRPGFLQSVFGNPNNRSQFMAALGAGLKSGMAGQPGGLAAFGRGAGGALTGANAEQQQQFKNKLAASTAAQQAAFRDSQIAFYDARARALDLGQTGRTAWQTSPWGKASMAEARIRQQMQSLNDELKLKYGQYPSDEQRQAAAKEYNQRSQDIRANTYKAMGVDPGEAAKLQTVGQTRDNPFPAMPHDRFNQLVPVGSYYKDEQGNVKYRNKDQNGNEAPVGTSGFGQSQAAANAALQPAPSDYETGIY